MTDLLNDACGSIALKMDSVIVLRDQLASRDAEIVVLRQAALDYDKRWHEEQVRCDQLREQVTLLRYLLLRYRTDVSPGFQPHMICLEVDAALAATEQP